MSLSIKDIDQAAAVLDGVIKETPLWYSRTFSERTGAEVFLKHENLQLTGSFKIRGAYNRIWHLSDDEKARGVVCASAGNHAQGVAYAAARMGVQSDIFMPVFAPPSKIQATRGYGAVVHLTGTYFDEAYSAARHYADVHHKPFIPAFDDAHVIAGQGTIGQEIHRAEPDLEVVVCPVGGGGLIAGAALALKHLNPAIRVIGVEAEGAQAMKLSLAQGTIVPMPQMQTIADGIAVQTPGALTFPLIQQYVDEIVTVPDSETAYALFLLAQRVKQIAEPAGAVGLAALLSGHLRLEGRKVGVILSGGNVDFALFAQMIERGLLRDGLRAQLAVDAPDRPGVLHALLEILAGLRANIHTISHDRDAPGIPLGQVRITVTFRTQGRDQLTAISQALHEAGFDHRIQ